MRGKKEKTGIVTLVILLIAFVLAFYCTFLAYSYSGLKMAAIFIGVTILLLSIPFSLRKKETKLAFGLGIIFIVILLLFSALGFKADRTLSKTEAKTEYETVQIAVLKDSSITEESDFNNLQLAYVTTEDGVYDRFTEILNEHDKKVGKSSSYETAEGAYKAIKSGKRDLIVLTSYVRSELEEEDIDYTKNLRILFEKKYEIGKIEDKSVDIRKEPFTVYLQGIDNSAGSNINTAARGDVNILLTVNPNTEKVNLQVIPRDTFVYVESIGGSTKLSYSGVWGGTQSSINSIENKFGIDINYYAKINFQGIIDLVDALGGVSAYSHYTYSSGSYTFYEGYNNMNGEQALEFARERKSLPHNELDRGVHQMELIKAIFRKFAENPDYNAAMGVVNTISNNFVTNIPKKDYMKAFELVVRLMPELKNMENHSIKGEYRWHIDEINPSKYKYYYYPDKEETERVRNDIENILH